MSDTPNVDAIWDTCKSHMYRRLRIWELARSLERGQGFLKSDLSAALLLLQEAELDAARYRGWRKLWCMDDDTGLSILNKHIGNGGGEPEHDAGIDAAIALSAGGKGE